MPLTQPPCLYLPLQVSKGLQGGGAAVSPYGGRGGNSSQQDPRAETKTLRIQELQLRFINTRMRQSLALRTGKVCMGGRCPGTAETKTLRIQELQLRFINTRMRQSLALRTGKA